MVLTGTGNDVFSPSDVMVTSTSTWTLHPTIASIEIATTAQIKAMSGVGTQKILTRNLIDKQNVLINGLTFQFSQIGNVNVIVVMVMISVIIGFIDGRQPF